MESRHKVKQLHDQMMGRLYHLELQGEADSVEYHQLQAASAALEYALGEDDRVVEIFDDLRDY